MARFDDLLTRVGDPDLRAQLAAAHAELRDQSRFGIVFEEHLPETTTLYGLAIRAGALVQKRADRDGQTYIVREVQDGMAEIVARVEQAPYHVSL